MANDRYINSLFDSILLSEDKLVSEGYEKGTRPGRRGEVG